MRRSSHRRPVTVNARPPIDGSAHPRTRALSRAIRGFAFAFAGFAFAGFAFAFAAGFAFAAAFAFAAGFGFAFAAGFTVAFAFAADLAFVAAFAFPFLLGGTTSVSIAAGGNLSTCAVHFPSVAGTRCALALRRVTHRLGARGRHVAPSFPR